MFYVNCELPVFLNIYVQRTRGVQAGTDLWSTGP